jgi:hypothetical protein
MFIPASPLRVMIATLLAWGLSASPTASGQSKKVCIKSAREELKAARREAKEAFQASKRACNGASGGGGGGPRPRYTDNGDGTVTDSRGLMWEKKTNLEGSEDLTNPNDADNRYTWSAGDGSSGPPSMTGTVFTDFLAKLNTPPCFAGHCDWRPPTHSGFEEQATGAQPELDGTIDRSRAGCRSDTASSDEPVIGEGVPCVDVALDPTPAFSSFNDSSVYWSASPDTLVGKGRGSGSSGLVWVVSTFDGNTGLLKDARSTAFARAVRTAQ